MILEYYSILLKTCWQDCLRHDPRHVRLIAGHSGGLYFFFSQQLDIIVVMAVYNVFYKEQCKLRVEYQIYI
jgi:hypothetical protein